MEDNLVLAAYTRSDRHVREDIENLLSLFPALGVRRRKPADIVKAGRRGILIGAEQQKIGYGEVIQFV